jgi:hypothetical protein
MNDTMPGVLTPKDAEALGGRALRTLLKAVKHPNDLVRAWLPELFKVPFWPKRREREGWLRTRTMKALPGKLTALANDVELASRSCRVYLSKPMGYPPGIIGALAQQMRQGAEFLRKAMSSPDLTPRPSVQAVRICGLLEWIKTETGRYYCGEVACLLDLAFLASTGGKEGGPDPAELRMMMKRTSSSLRKNVAGIAMQWANDAELPADFRVLMRHAARET